MPSTAAISNPIITLAFSALSAAVWVNLKFRHVFPLEATLAAVLAAAGLIYCPGLLDVVQNATPPPVSWFQALSTVIPINVWAVYALVLTKSGCRPKLYVGSGTNTTRGVRARMYEYDVLKVIPDYVQLALDDGYAITTKALLVYCPIPAPAQQVTVRYAIYTLEAALSCILSAFVNPGKRYGFGDLFTWPRATHNFEYDGLCSHSAFLDPVRGDLNLSPEELEEIAARVREKDRVYQNEYHAAMRANPTEQYKLTHTRNNRIQAPKTKKRQQAAKAVQKYFCKPCSVNCRDDASLRRHNRTKRHSKKLVMGDSDYYCDLCDSPHRYLSA